MTVVPVDDELEAVSPCWLAIRSDSLSPAEPSFADTASEWGRRLEPDAVHHVVTTHAADASWHQASGDHEENVVPHYFRHFFTTHLWGRAGDRGIVKYLRGDIAGDITDMYAHNWGDRARETYGSNTHSFR